MIFNAALLNPMAQMPYSHKKLNPHFSGEPYEKTGFNQHFFQHGDTFNASSAQANQILLAPQEPIPMNLMTMGFSDAYTPVPGQSDFSMVNTPYSPFTASSPFTQYSNAAAKHGQVIRAFKQQIGVKAGTLDEFEFDRLAEKVEHPERAESPLDSTILSDAMNESGKNLTERHKRRIQDVIEYIQACQHPSSPFITGATQRIDTPQQEAPTAASSPLSELSDDSDMEKAPTRATRARQPREKRVKNELTDLDAALQQATSKVDKKRIQNTQRARKSRQRKVEYTEALENKVEELKAQLKEAKKQNGN